MHRISEILLATRWRQASLCALACALLIGGLHIRDRLDSVHLANYDFALRSRGTLPPHPKIILLTIDSNTVAAYDQWPLPRSMYADIIRRLDSYGARTVIFDVLFATESGVSQEDQALFAASKQAGNVVHAISFEHINTNDPVSEAQSYIASTAVEPQSRFQISPQVSLHEFNQLARDSSMLARRSMAARPELQQHGVALGHINAPADADGTLRNIPHLFFTYSGSEENPTLTGIYPSLALAGAASYLGLKPDEIRATPNAIFLADRRIPINEHGRTLVNWVGGPNTFPTDSVAAFLGKSRSAQSRQESVLLPKEAYKDSVVLVGFTAAAAYEHRPTPIHSQQAAMEMQASALDNILEDRFLHEAPPWAPIVLVLCFCLLGSLAAAWRGAFVGTLLTLSAGLALLLVSLLLIRSHNFYLPTVVPILAGIISCAAFTIFLQLQDAYSLRIAEERYALAVSGANDGLWDWNLQTDTIYYSPRWKSMLGCDEDEIGHSWRDWSSRIHPDDLEQVKLEIKAHLNGHSPHFENEHRILHRDGTYRWVLSRGLAVRNGQGHPTRMAGSMSDIHDRKVAEEQIRHDAIHDGLTELPNRTLFGDRLSNALERAKSQPDYQFAVLFLDLDHFKVVNDSLGHTLGDDLLKEVAHRLESCLRPGDTAARLSGDEFTVLLENLRHVSQATNIAEHIQQELARPFILRDADGAEHEVFVTTSIGIAFNEASETYPSAASRQDQETVEYSEIDPLAEMTEAVVEGRNSAANGAANGKDGTPANPVSTRYQSPDELLRDADTAMYRAKAMGPARHAVFDEAMHSKAMAQLHLQTDLRHGLEREEFEPYFQPIISLETGVISSFEALVRWNHPTRGFISPAHFIPMAEETGIIVQLDQATLRAACHQAVLWQQAVPEGFTAPSVSVNLSVQQFWQADMVERVEKILSETGLHPHRLKLEITESAIMHNAESAAAMLRQLQELGIALSIDDFGTGYSSLAYLQKFPLDTLKIDQSFVRAIGTADESSEIVWTIIALARNLGMDVIAEGVETIEHLAQLKRLTCDYGQGYYFSRPVAAAEALNMIGDIGQWEKTVLREGEARTPILDIAAVLNDKEAADDVQSVNGKETSDAQSRDSSGYAL